VLSDTHGPVSKAALDALAGVDHIIHAGDIVSGDVVPALERVAPVTAVAGNMDGSGAGLPSTNVAAVGGVRIYVLHDVDRLDVNPRGAGFAAVVHGHTHRADATWRDGVLYLNPGSARPGRRPTIARLTIDDHGKLSAAIIALTDS
jgi:putative phosphoesterase